MNQKQLHQKQLNGPGCGRDAGAWPLPRRVRLLQQLETRQLCRLVPHLVGYRLLQVGLWGDGDYRHVDPRLYHWVASLPGESGGDLRFDGVALPIASRSLDAVVLPHSLERCPAPHRLLREVERVLRESGQVVILGFNPYAPWTLAQRLTPRHSCVRRCFGTRRVRDWLDLLDFEVVAMRRYGLGFPWLPADGVDPARRGAWALPALLSQAWLMVARKRALPMTPLRQQSRRQRKVLRPGVAEPTSRQSHAAREALEQPRTPEAA